MCLCDKPKRIAGEQSSRARTDLLETSTRRDVTFVRHQIGHSLSLCGISSCSTKIVTYFDLGEASCSSNFSDSQINIYHFICQILQPDHQNVFFHENRK